MGRTIWILLSIILMFGIVCGSLAVEECATPVPCVGEHGGSGSIPAISEGDICIYYFYGQACPHCTRIKPFIDKMAATYSRVRIYSLEVHSNVSNLAIFRDFCSRYDIDITKAGVPTIFIGDRALMGESVIRENLEPSIQYFYVNEPICPTTYKKYEGTPHDISPWEKINLTVPSVIVAAAIDSINPCAFAVLIFLLVYLSTLANRSRILIIGMTYIIAVFTVYFFSGLGFFTLVQSMGITDVVFKLAAVIAILAGVVNVKDFFWYGRGISLSIPESKKETIKKYVIKASIPSALILGGLVSIFELPCTGGIYLAILGLLSSKMTLAQGIPYLLIYNVIFVLPLIGILLFVHYGVSVETMESWKGGGRRWMRLAMGVLMIALGALMLLGML